MKSKYIFVTGGVLSGIGKGVSAASLGRLLISKGYSVFVQKFDPYLNFDPGTMSPYQHGEVFVTSDGAETDLDLGHYERFIDTELTRLSNWTQGKLLMEVIDNERKGLYNGNTVQTVPHVTNIIESKIIQAGKESKADFIIVEIGGTVGDIESQPFYYAIASFARKYPNNSLFLHATYLPYLEASKEFKTKPTQHSVSFLQSLGIFPNMLILRANKEIPKEMVLKVANKINISIEKILAVPNAKCVYEVPINFEKMKVAEQVEKHFGMRVKKVNLTVWKSVVKKLLKNNEETITVALVGKYVEFEDAYKSIVEGLTVSAAINDLNINFKWISSDNINKSNVKNKLGKVDGIVILPGFGVRGFEGKVETVTFARDNDIPTLGICYGLQAMVVEQARRIGIKDATTSETSDKGTFVIDILRGKNKNEELGGTLRLGNYTAKLKDNSVVAKLYKSNTVVERHRHRYEVSPKFMDQLEDEEFKFSGFDVKDGLVEYVEIPSNKFFVGLQAHLEFRATPLNPHPLFNGLIKAIKNNKSA